MLHESAKFPKNEETRNNATSFLESLTGTYTYPREPDEESTRSWTYRSRESDRTGGICFLPSDQYKISHQIPSTKKKTAR